MPQYIPPTNNPSAPPPYPYPPYPGQNTSYPPYPSQNPPYPSPNPPYPTQPSIYIPPTQPPYQPTYPSYPQPPAHGPPSHSYYWTASSYGSVPPMAVRAGTDKNGETIYVGRSFHNGDTVPGKIVQSHQCAYVAWGGDEHRKEHYDVLCAQDYSWHSGEHGSVPDDAVQCGQTTAGETLFVGRVMHDGTLTPGKVHPSHGCIYIPYDGKELSFQQYEVLVVH